MTERKRLTKMMLPIGVYHQSGDSTTMGPPKKVGSGARRAKTASKGSSRTRPRD